MVIAVQEVSAVVDRIAEGSSQSNHRISHQRNIITVVNIATMLDNALKQLVVLQEAVPITASTNGSITLKREKAHQELGVEDSFRFPNL